MHADGPYPLLASEAWVSEMNVRSEAIGDAPFEVDLREHLEVVDAPSMDVSRWSLRSVWDLFPCLLVGWFVRPPDLTSVVNTPASVSREQMAAVCLHMSGGSFLPGSDTPRFDDPLPLISYELFGLYVMGGHRPPSGSGPTFASPVLTPSEARSNAEVNERRRSNGVAGWLYVVI